MERLKGLKGVKGIERLKGLKGVKGIERLNLKNKIELNKI
jgi:hypothetical protein